MNITPHILLGSGRLTPFVKQIKEAFNKAIEKINNKVSISDVDVVIYDNPYDLSPEREVGGFTPNAHTIFISLGPGSPKFTEAITKELGRTLTHEMHHILRLRNSDYDKTLLEALITEGLADHFDIEINNEDPKPWCVALNEKQLKEFLAEARREFNNKNYDYESWFFGSEEKNIPKWTGYSLGYKLVNDFLQKNPDKKPSNLYTLKAEKFIK